MWELYDTANETYTNIRNRIISLDLKPDEMFSENSMAQELGARKVLVREVFAQLEEEGYINVYPQRGTFVSRINLEKAKQAAQAHTMLEQEIIKELIQRGITKDEVDILKGILKQLEKEKKNNNLVEVIVKERELLYQLSVFCHKDFIWNIFQRMDSDLLRFQYLQHFTFNHQGYDNHPSSIDFILIESKLLVDSLVRGDEGVAVLNRMNCYAKAIWQAETINNFYPQYFI